MYFVVTVAWLLPHSSLKVWLLNRLGNRIHTSARIGINLVLGGGNFDLAEGCCIGSGNIFRNVRRVECGAGATVGSWNFFSAHPAGVAFTDNWGVLQLSPGAFVTSRHYFDCTATIMLDSFAAVGGHGSQLLTHSIDFKSNNQAAAPIVVGTRSFVGTRCTVLGGVQIPSASLVAAGSVVAQSPPESGVLIAGVPGKAIRPIDGMWFHRAESATRSVRHTDGTVRHRVF